MSFLKKFLKKLLARLLTSPPPLIWRFKNGFPHVEWLGIKTWRSFPSVALKQLSWWIVWPLFVRWKRRVYQNSRLIDAPPAPPPLPRRLAVAACWLNSFMPYEVRIWRALGLTTWDQISQKIPQSHIHAIHAARRTHWPDQCVPAKEVLSNKAALLELAEPAWRSPYLVLHGLILSLETPDWWHLALTGPGLVLKPLNGHAGRGVVRFWLDGEQLLFEALGQPIKELTSEGCTSSSDFSPSGLLKYWQQLITRRETALAMPFLQQGPSLPDSHFASVVRVITEQTALEAPVRIQIAWLCVPLPTSQEGMNPPISLINLQGRVLPRPGLNLDEEQWRQQANWQAMLAKGPIASVECCLERSIAMHKRLPPIDQVAWEWIPTEPEVQLLEGNSGFGLMVPQMFNVMQTESYKTWRAPSNP